MEQLLSLKNIRFWLFVSLLCLAPLSKYPSIALPAYNFTSFRIGLYQILAAIFVLLCTVPTLKNLKNLYNQNRIVFVSLLLLACTTLTGIYSAINKARSSLLIVSILFLIALVFAAWWYVRYEFPKSKYLLVARVFLQAGIVIGLAAILEFFILTLTNASGRIICGGCDSSIFGFPRINLFAAEPQFLSSSMLPYLFVGLGFYYFKKTRLALFCLIISTLVIALTFSRGAYLALGVGFVSYFLLILAAEKLNLMKTATIFMVIIATFFTGALMLVWSASNKYNSTPNITYNTVDTMLDHMTLGLVNLPNKTAEQPADPSPPKEEANFESPGLIETSTQDRVGAARLAIDSWNTNPKTELLGLGAGNLGPYTNKRIGQSVPDNLTVYIYYVLLLAEIGLIGLVAFLLVYASSLWQLIKTYFKSKSWPLYATAVSLTIAFLTQYWFFGTYINTVYIWLWAGIILGLAGIDRRYIIKRSNEK